MHRMYRLLLSTSTWFPSLASLSDKFEPFLRNEDIAFDGPRFSMGLVEKHIAEAGKWQSGLWAIVFAERPKLWTFVDF